MQETTPKRISDFRIPAPQPVANANLHTEVHEFIDETRKEFEDALPFGRWLAACKGFTLFELRDVRAWVRGSKAKAPAKLFFWKLRELKKAQKQHGS